MPDAASAKPASHGGLFLSFEGLDGSGKGTQIDLLVGHLATLGIQPVVHREPGGTVIGDQIRAILLDAANSHLLPLPELLLYFASRAQAIDEVILPALQAGRVVISDRFTDSTLVYQGIVRGLGIDVVRDLDRISCRALRPDCTILLDLPPEHSQQRAAARNLQSASTQTRLDDESLDFYRSVREGYLQLASAEPARIRVVDASGSVEAVGQQVQAIVAEVLRQAGNLIGGPSSNL
jgi:dTMP kinase